MKYLLLSFSHAYILKRTKARECVSQLICCDIFKFSYIYLVGIEFCIKVLCCFRVRLKKNG